VAKRFDDLIEISPKRANSKEPKETGRHRIYVVSQTNCDKAEADFIAELAGKLLNDRR
jgi:hypothetical protein